MEATIGYEVLHAVELDRKLINPRANSNSKKTLQPVKAIYHDPCDMGRHMGVYEPPRNVLKALPGVELLEFPLNRAQAKCCGGGGGMKGFDNEMAGEIGYKRLLSAIDLGADVIVSACPSCKGSFNQAAARAERKREAKSR